MLEPIPKMYSAVNSKNVQFRKVAMFASNVKIFIKKFERSIYEDIDQDIHQWGKVARNEKRKKTTWVFVFQKYDKL